MEQRNGCETRMTESNISLDTGTEKHGRKTDNEVNEFINNKGVRERGGDNL